MLVCAHVFMHACMHVWKIKHRKFILLLLLTIRAIDFLPDLINLTSVSPFKKKLFFLSNVSSIIPLTYPTIHYKILRITIRRI